MQNEDGHKHGCGLDREVLFKEKMEEKGVKEETAVDDAYGKPNG